MTQRKVDHLDVWGAFFSGDILRREAIAIATKIPAHLLRDLVTAMEMIEISESI